MKTITGKISLITIVAISIFLLAYRMSNVREKETSWDVLGYYMHLPSTFIYGEPMLNDYSWLKKVNEERGLTGTLYQVSTNDEGEPMYFFLIGMALFYLPFFLAGHGYASMSSFPADGFSMPYQYMLVFGGILYTIIGLIFLRKILRHFFSDGLAATIIVIIVFGTNYIHHLTLDNLGTVNILFMLTSIIVWHTIKWYESFKLKNLLIIGASMTMMVLVKPSEVFVLFIFLLWNITSLKDVKEKLLLFLNKKASILITIGVCLIIASPQLLYWYFKTGHILYDSYKNPGVGLDIFSPHIKNALFSYRKGWLLYTPVMILSLLGFITLFKSNRKAFWSIAVYFVLSFYIIASWSEWWYGAGFSNRPVIAAYPLLAVTMGYFLDYIRKKHLIVKVLLGLVVACFIFLNQFQWWQLKNYILDPYRTTKEYYWATFLKTKVSDTDRELLMVYRDFSGDQKFTNHDKYSHKVLNMWTFDELEGDNILRDSTGNPYYRMKDDQEFSITFDYKYNQLSNRDHVWLKASLDVRYPEGFEGPMPCLVMTMDYKGGCYGYLAPEIKSDIRGTWIHYELEYLTPEIRDVNNSFKCYVWKRGGQGFDIDNFKMELFQEW